MDERQQKGLVIAATARIAKQGGMWVVPSQSDKGRYGVTIEGDAKHCTCPDFELRQQACKHIYAIEYVIKRETVTDPNGVTTITETAGVRVTYAQNWPAYNAAQVSEKAQFLTLLRDLCAGAEEAPQTNGRPRLPLADRLFCTAFKVYSGMSARRFSTDLREAHADGLMSDAPAYNSVIRYLEDETLTPVIKEMITRSTLPLKSVETDFAIDSTGFTSTQLVGLWQSAKYGSKRPRQEHDWLKLHAVCGVKTNVITSVEVTERNSQDAPQFAGLINNTMDHFNVERVQGDKAYSTHAGLELVASRGATPFIPFKSYAVASGKSSVWDKLLGYYLMNRGEFLAIYHPRSNVESTFSMVKRIFGDTVRSKTRVAQINEVLLKVLCHNIRCLIHECAELGIQPAF